MAGETIIHTERIVIRQATEGDAPFLYAIWTNPQVMVNVGYPQGLPITLEEVKASLREKETVAVFGRYLVAGLREDGTSIGECKMMLPDEQGISRTDVKLLPEFWGHHFGVEIKRALVDYLFTHTDCRAVEGTPNVNNIASIKMQEAVGGVRVSEDVFRFPASKADYTQAVHHYVYLVYRDTWASRRSDDYS